MDKQWRKIDAVSRTVLHMNIPDLGRVYQHPFKAYRQAGHSVVTCNMCNMVLS